MGLLEPAGGGIGLSLAAAGMLWATRDQNTGSRSTSWGTGRQLRPLTVRSPQPGRITLGHAGRRLIATEPQHSLLVVGPTGSYKTTGLTIPAILEWSGPVLSVSAKPDGFTATAGARNLLDGDVQVYDLSGVVDSQSGGWSPLPAAATPLGAEQVAYAMARLSGTTSGLGGSNHWERVAKRLIAPLLHACHLGGYSLDQFIKWVLTGNHNEAIRLLDGAGATVFAAQLRAHGEKDPKYQASAAGTVETVIDAYSHPRVLELANSPTITPGWLLDGRPNSLYLIGAPAEQQLLAPVFLALIDELLKAALAAGMRGRPSRLLVVLDEAANIAPLPDLATLASISRDLGVQLITVYQDLAQPREVYGTKWATVVNNHLAKLGLSGITDQETLRYFTGTIGQEDLNTASSSSGPGGVTVSSRPERRPVIDERRMRELPPGSGVLLYGSRPPVRVRLRPFWRIPAWKHLPPPAITPLAATTVDAAADVDGPAWSWLIGKLAAGQAIRLGVDGPVWADGVYYIPDGPRAAAVSDPARILALDALRTRLGATL